jgi:fructose-bisphosphate aldolase class I
VLATRHLDAINRADGPKAWKFSFSYGRALQDAALGAWRGKPESVHSAQKAFYHRARCNSLAAVGAYSALEEQHFNEPPLSLAAEWRDD